MTSPLLIRAAALAQAVVEDLQEPSLSGADFDHISKALRARPGETVIATDGRGSWRPCTWRGDPALEPAGPVDFELRLEPTLTVAFSLLKGDRSEWVIQKLTEVGIDRIVPLAAEHTIVRWDEKKSARNLERFSRVAYEASMQSRRVWIPEVVAPSTFAQVAGGGAALAQPGGAPISLATPVVAIGPEGGWSTNELASEAPLVDLGSTILRAETAAMTAGVLLCNLRSKQFR